MPQPSYSQGNQDKPLLTQCIGDAFDTTVARFPDRDALVVRTRPCATPGSNWPKPSTSMPVR